MICKIVSDSSCDLRMSEFDGGDLLKPALKMPAIRSRNQIYLLT